MKATGIVRRIDDLGRVVIPKEIRRTMRIREGDPSLSTLTVNFRAYSYLSDLENRLEHPKMPYRLPRTPFCINNPRLLDSALSNKRGQRSLT